MEIEADRGKKKREKDKNEVPRFGQLDLISLLSVCSKWIKGFRVLVAHVL